MDDVRPVESKHASSLTSNVLSHATTTENTSQRDTSFLQTLRHKPGPQKKEYRRSEKISCRLTEEEKEEGERYCKKHGITEAKLLRASYLAATLQTQKQIDGIADAILCLIETDKAIDRRWLLKEKIVTILRKSGVYVLLLLLGIFLSSAPSIAKYLIHYYELGKVYVMHPNEAWIVHDSDKGWEVVPHKSVLPAPDSDFMKKLQRLPLGQPPSNMQPLAAPPSQIPTAPQILPESPK
jgi:hypothetical protein